MTAAPSLFILLACSTKVSSPCFSDIELTIHFPWQHFSPASMTSKRLESTMTGTRHTEGSDMRRLRNCVISLRVSSSPSSMFTSTTMAPFSICVRAISRASSYLCSFMSLRNFLDPATLHLSPTMTKSRFPNSNLSSPVTVSRSAFSPSSAMLAVPCGVSAVVWGFMAAMVLPPYPLSSLPKASMWLGVVPQHPPMISTSPSLTMGIICLTISSGVSSYCPISLGSPALGWHATRHRPPITFRMRLR